jgi:hypothetical protein
MAEVQGSIPSHLLAIIGYSIRRSNKNNNINIYISGSSNQEELLQEIYINKSIKKVGY